MLSKKREALIGKKLYRISMKRIRDGSYNQGHEITNNTSTKVYCGQPLDVIFKNGIFFPYTYLVYTTNKYTVEINKNDILDMEIEEYEKYIEVVKSNINDYEEKIEECKKKIPELEKHIKSIERLR
jgi:hypothetical protein